MDQTARPSPPATKTAQRRRLDAPSAILTLIGLISGLLCCWLIVTAAFSPLLALPPLLAIATGATHLATRRAPRE